VSDEINLSGVQEEKKNPDAGVSGEKTDSVLDNEKTLETEEREAKEFEEKLAQVLDENTRLNKELSDLKDQYLRSRADFENTRKRLQRDKEESIQQANRQLIEDLLPVIDDFERAISSAAESKDFDTFFNGIEMIERQFYGVLERKWGLSRLESLGEAFDPSKHEAIAMEQKEGVESQQVLEEYQRGYVLKDKILRTAKVKVSS